MSYCDDCVLSDLCGIEGKFDEAMTFCDDKNRFVPVSVIEDIKAEIEETPTEESLYDRILASGLHYALKIIDKHISGKEQE